jgi:hypothetical protein
MEKTPLKHFAGLLLIASLVLSQAGLPRTDWQKNCP